MSEAPVDPVEMETNPMVSSKEEEVVAAVADAAVTEVPAVEEAAKVSAPAAEVTLEAEAPEASVAAAAVAPEATAAADETPEASIAVKVAAEPTTADETPEASVAARTKGAQSAFAKGNAAASKAAHEANAGAGAAPETHRKGLDLIKSVTFGGLDGIITTFAIVAATAGAESLGIGTVILMGLANLIADAISMGMGDWVSETAEIEFQRMEVAREAWEFLNFPDGEIDEMCDIYLETLKDEVAEAAEKIEASEKLGVGEKGKLSAPALAQLVAVAARTESDMRTDAESILRTMAKYPDFFVNHMCVQELEFMPPDNEWWEPPLQGLVTFLSFVFFGFVPLSVYVALFAVPMNKYILFAISCAMTMMAMFALGVAKTAMFDCRWYMLLKGGLGIMLVGSISAGSAFGIGAGIDAIIKVVPSLNAHEGGC